MTEFVKPQVIDLRRSSEYDERWLQHRIFEDPSLLGLGNLRVVDKERRQPSGGRIDLVLADDENKRRYEVEIQLGPTDPSHIVRTIEYWDIERKRYPIYDHVAVIVAEHVTGRFLNVISLFNGVIPLIAIQIQCVSVGGFVTIVASRVLDVVSRGDDEDSIDAAENVSLQHWERNKQFKQVAENISLIIKGIDAELELSPTKAYVGARRRNRACNFFALWPRSNGSVMEIKAGPNIGIEEIVEEGSLDYSGYDAKYDVHRIKIIPSNFPSKEQYIKSVLKIAYDNWFDN